MIMNRLKVVIGLLVVFITSLLFMCDFASRLGHYLNPYTSGVSTVTCHSADSIIDFPELGYRWVKITCSAEFAPRDGAGALVFKDSLRLIGGWNPDDKNNFPLTCNNEVWSSYDGKRWSRSKKNTFISSHTFDPLSDWEGRHTAGYVVFQDRMWIIGGDANQGHYISDIWSSVDGRNWELETRAPNWAKRVLHHTLVFNNKVFVIGGQTLPQFARADEKFYNDVWCSEDGINYTCVSKAANFPPRGMIGGSVVFEEKIWILGGGTYDTPSTKNRRFYNDVWCSEDGISWTLISANAPWKPRQYHEVAVWDNNMWVLGGYYQEGGNRNDVWFSDNGKDWVELPNTPWKERHASSVYVFNDALWVVTGNNMENDVWKLEKINC